MNVGTSWPPKVGELLPRAAKAYATPEKLAWILSEEGHGREWARLLRVGEHDTRRFWATIARAVVDARIRKVIDRQPEGVVCGVETALTIGGRTAKTLTSWHYEHTLDAPRLVTAYPRL